MLLILFFLIFPALGLVSGYIQMIRSQPLLPAPYEALSWKQMLCSEGGEPPAGPGVFAPRCRARREGTLLFPLDFGIGCAFAAVPCEQNTLLNSAVETVWKQKV